MDGPAIGREQIHALVHGDDATRKAIETALEDCGWMYWICTDAYHKVSPDRMEAYRTARSQGFV